MRAQKVILFICIVFVLTSLPIASYALTVKANGVEIGSSTLTDCVGGVLPTCVPGVFTTTVTLSNVVVGGFTISGTVSAEQEQNVERILFLGVQIITGPVSCSPAFPCDLEITATSGPTDFPRAKAPNDYPAVVIMSAAFTSTTPGNKLSATGMGQGDVINLTKGGVGDTRVSLPSADTGNPTASFTTIGDPTGETFNDLISEPVQLVCGEATTCRSSLSHKINVRFVGTSLNLPFGGSVQASIPSSAPLIGIVPPLIGTSLKLFSTKVEIDAHDKEFELKTSFTVNGDGIINPSIEDVSFSVGPFLTTIPAGRFRQRPKGRFTFEGFIDGVKLEAQIVSRGPKTFEFEAEGKGANLAGIRKPVPVGLKIGDNSGATWDTRLDQEVDAEIEGSRRRHR